MPNVSSNENEGNGDGDKKKGVTSSTCIFLHAVFVDIILILGNACIMIPIILIYE